MNQAIQIAKAEAFRKLHNGSGILILPNAWDVASARLLEAAGLFLPSLLPVRALIGPWAIPTANASAYIPCWKPYAESLSSSPCLLPPTWFLVLAPRRMMLPRRYAASSPRGAVGLNLEDGTGDPLNPLVDVYVHVEKVQAAREAATKTGVPIVINARTDVFLAAVGAPDTRLDHAVRRANAYREAGADCLFVPGVQDSVTISHLGPVDRRPA